MTQLGGATSGLVRVTVSSGSRRVDLVLPGAVPLAELVPELARSVGLLDAATAYGGYRVVLADGRRLAGEVGLIPQGVADGGVLTVTAAVDDPTPRVYDDVVEAMTDVVETELRPWRPEAGRRTALVAACVLLALGAVALLAQGASALAGAAAAVIAVVLVGGAVVLSRAEDETDAAVAVGLMAQAYGAAAGLLLGLHQTSAPVQTLPLAWAGAGALAAGVLCLLGVASGRMLMLPGAVAGLVFGGSGALLYATDWRAGVVLAVVLTVVVLAGGVFPWLALSMTSTDVQRLYAPGDITAEPGEIDRSRVLTDAAVAHEILVAITATVGLLVVLIAPFVVALGLAGTLLMVAACLALMLRTRQYRTGPEVLTGLGSGILGLASLGLAVLWLHPDWRPTLAVVLAAAGGVLLALTLVPGVATIRRGRLADVAESAVLIALVPLVVVASGLLSSVSV
ncbi:MAG: EsaB/YukD family protein [Nocardioides sp.]|uniref:EsaB/YukD family protein n=1 Tax=Nocardioides sp. TaxID=35761 RepID=UPI0039E2AC7F